MKAQFAIQGGGAKFVSILPVIDAIRSFDGHLEITRVSGTSAGAIAAALLAADVPMDRVISALKGDYGKRVERELSAISWPKVAWKVLVRRDPVWDMAPLRALLVHFLGDATKFSDIRKRTGIELRIVSSHLDSRARQVHSGDENVVDAVLNSCALPFLFKIWDKQNNPVIVDGGLCENLPVMDLIDDEERFGKVAAISFAPVEPGPKDRRPRSLGAFAMSMVDTVINHPVTTAKRVLPPSSVFSIDSSLHLLDFAAAFSDQHLGGDRYQLLRRQATEFLNNFTRIRNNRPMDLGDDPWTSEDPLAIRIMERLDTFRKGAVATATIVRKKTVLLAYLHGLADSTQLDEVRSTLVFEVKGRALAQYAVGVILGVKHGVGNTMRYFEGSSISWRVSHNGSPVDGEIHWLPALERILDVQNQSEEIIRRIILLFSPPLEPSDTPYTLEIGYRVEKFLPKIYSKEKSDELAFRASNNGPVGEATVAIFVPDQVRNEWSMSLLNCEGFVSKYLTEAERNHAFELRPGYTGCGIHGTQIPAGKKLSLQITQVAKVD